MIKILTIIGARPQIIKAAALSRGIRERFAGEIEEHILHTGQHYDENMSQIFFEELGIPRPHFNLQVGSGKHGEQSAKMIEGIERVLMQEQYDAMVVYGDTNSTLAGAIAASKLHIPIVHIEAGLRSHNMSMPEEVNRIVCDHLSSILFTPTLTGMENLEREGFMGSKATFANGKGREVYHTGDIMYDNSLHFAQSSGDKCDILHRYELSENGFILATIHRDNNTDNCKRLNSIFTALIDIAEKESNKIVLPLHPRTAKLLQTNLQEEVYAKAMEMITIVPPASFLEMIELEKSAQMVITDSGGVQKESYFFKKPCLILRPETEWVEIVNQGAAIVTDANYHQIVNGYYALKDRVIDFPPIFGDGKAAIFMLEKILKYLNK